MKTPNIDHNSNLKITIQLTLLPIVGTIILKCILYNLHLNPYLKEVIILCPHVLVRLACEGLS